MKPSGALGIGLSLIALFVFVALLDIDFGLRHKRYYYISLPQQALLCTAGKTHANGWRTIVCTRVDTLNPASDTDATTLSSWRTMELKW